MYNFPNNSFANKLLQQLPANDNRLKIKKGTFLFQEGMPAAELYIILSGWVRESKISSDGKEISLSVCSSGDIVGDRTIYVKDAKYMVSAIVLEDGEAVVIKKDFLEEQLLTNQSLVIEYLKWLSNYVCKAQNKISDLILYGKKGAVYSTIIRMTKRHGKRKENGDILINVPLTYQELAKICGATYETVSRMLNDLCQHNVISIKNGRIIVHDLNYIKTEACCSNCPIDICGIN